MRSWIAANVKVETIKENKENLTGQKYGWVPKFTADIYGNGQSVHSIWVLANPKIRLCEDKKDSLFGLVLKTDFLASLSEIKCQQIVVYFREKLAFWLYHLRFQIRALTLTQKVGISTDEGFN